MTWWELMVRSMATPMGNIVTEVDGEVPPIEALLSALASSLHSYDIITAIIRGCRPTFYPQIPGNLAGYCVPSILGHASPAKYSRSLISVFSIVTLRSIASIELSRFHLKVIKYSTAKTTPPSPNVSKILGTHAILLHHSPHLFEVEQRATSNSK